MGTSREIPPEARVRIRDLASLGLSEKDIAEIVEIPRATLRRRCAQELEEGRCNLRKRLLQIQWTLAKRSPAMAIWLGKQFLGQRDNVLPEGMEGEIVEYIQKIIVTTPQQIQSQPSALPRADSTDEHGQKP